MNRIGKAMREKYYWMKKETAIYLVINNAGGHGTNDCVQEYTDRLRTEYNIQMIQRVLRSPFANVLDLGVWAALQAAVEKRHFMKRCHTDALVRSVMDTWVNGSLDDVISKVFKRLKKVLCLINEGEGGNDLVETQRGPKIDLKFDYGKNLEMIQTKRSLLDEFNEEVEIQFGEI